MKRLKEILTLLILMAAMLLCSVSAAADDSDDCLDGTCVFTQASSTITLPTLKHILIIGSTDICDQELADLFGATYEKAEFKTLYETETIEVNETPDMVFFLTTAADTVTREDGKNPVYLSGMKIRTVLKNLFTVVSEETPTAWVTLTDLNGSLSMQVESLESSTATLTDLNDSLSMSEQYRALQSAEDVLDRDTFVTSYSYFTSGESAEDRVQTANRILGPLSGAGLFAELLEVEDNTVYNDYIYYVSETGNDKANGKSPATAVQTGAKLWKNIVAERGNNMASFKENDRIIVRFTGKVLVSSNQSLMGMSVATTPKTADGKLIPVIFETYNYAETKQKAVLYTNYTPHDEGSSRMAIFAELTLRDVIISNEPKKGGTLAINKLWISRCTVTLEGAEFTNSTKKSWVLCSCQNCWDESFQDVPDDEEIDHVLIFKRGIYDETTGVDYVVGNAAPYLWRDAKDGGNIPEALNHFTEIIVENGATVGKIVGMTGKMPIMGVRITVNPGGVVNVIQATGDLAATVEFVVPITISIEGTIRGEIHGLGKKAEFSSDMSVYIKNAKIIGDPVKEDDSGIDFLGGRGSAFYGFGSVDVENSLIAMFCGLNQPSGIYFCGTGATLDAEGPYNICFDNTVVAMISNEKLNATEASISFGGAASELYSDCDITIRNGLFDMTNVEDEFFTFGSVDERGLFYDYSIQLGESGRKGPAFLGTDVYIGGKPAWYGPAVAIDNTTEVNEFQCLCLSIYDVTFEKNVYLLPVGMSGDSERSGVCGTVEVEVENGSFNGETHLINGAIYGNLHVNLLGGTFADLYDGTTVEDGSWVSGNVDMKYDDATILKLNGKEVKAEEPSTEDDNPGGSTIKANLPLILGSAGGAAVIALVVLLIIFKKKKKA